MSSTDVPKSTISGAKPISSGDTKTATTPINSPAKPITATSTNNSSAKTVASGVTKAATTIQAKIESLAGAGKTGDTKPIPATNYSRAKSIALSAVQAESNLTKINPQKISGNVSIFNKVFVLFMAIIIIAVSSSGYYIKKHCTDKNININSSMIEFFMGFGTGLIFYIFFDMLKILSIPIIIILGLFLSVIGSIYVNIYTKMDTKCTENSMITELSIGILGCGIGIITFALLYTALNFVKNPLTRIRFVALITSVFLIIIPSIIINMTNKCTDYDESVNKDTVKSVKISQIVSLVLSILLFVGICISFYFIPPIP